MIRTQAARIDNAANNMRDPIDISFAVKGIVGTASPVVGLLTSLQEQVEWHLRIISLIVGLLVGVLSLIAMIRKMRRRN